MRGACLIALLLAALSASPALALAVAAPPPGAVVAESAESGPPLNAEARLKRADYLLEYGDYRGLVKLLEDGLAAGVFEQSQLARVHRLLGIGYFIGKDIDKSRESFLSMLAQDPDAVLDPLYVPPSIVEFVDRIRASNKALLDTLRAQRDKRRDAPDPAKKPVTRVVIKESKPFAVVFIPFGAGQFLNDEPLKGGAFMASELACLTLNVASYFVTRGFRGADGYYSKENARQAKRWRIVQYSALGALGGIALTGIIEAAVRYKQKDGTSANVAQGPGDRRVALEKE